MDYVASILVENYNIERLRAFRNEEAARAYVVKLASRLSSLNGAGKTDSFVTLAEIYVILPSGVMRLAARFSGLDRGDGEWEGWD